MASYFESHFGGANELPGIVSKLCRSPIAAFAKKKTVLGAGRLDVDLPGHLKSLRDKHTT
jgi:hypothetical protein